MLNLWKNRLHGIRRFGREVLMSNTRLDEVMEEVGLAAKWEARGEARTRQEFAEKLIRKGWTGEEVAEMTGLDAGTVAELFGDSAS
jgi:hypothetical protein